MLSCLLARVRVDLGGGGQSAGNTAGELDKSRSERATSSLSPHPKPKLVMSHCVPFIPLFYFGGNQGTDK